MNEILVDVIVPVYNTEIYLDNFFDSLVRQTVKCFKLIIVYDKSEDESLKIINKYQNIFGDRLVLIKNSKRKGLAHARNVALDSKYIVSKYISFLDPDDYVEKCFFEKMINSIEKNESDLVSCGFKRIDYENNKVISIDMINNPEFLVNPSLNSKSIFFNVAVWNKLYKKENIINFRFDEVKRSEDLSYFLKVMTSTKKMSFINEPLYNYTIRNDSLSQTYTIDHLEPVLNNILLTTSKIPDLSSHYSFVCGLLFFRICIGICYRIYSYDKKQYKMAKLKCKQFMNRYFEKWNKTYYLSFRESLKNGKKSFFVWVYKILYKTNLERIALRYYLISSRKKGKEMHW